MKDPAILFYTSDFLTGTMLLTDEQVGKYIRLLCLQHQKGHLSEKDMLNICKSKDEDIFCKFKQDQEGKYFNLRLETETLKRINYSESRRNNRLSKNNSLNNNKHMNIISKSYVKHMENENINENENIIISEDKKKKKGKKQIKLDYTILNENDLTDQLKEENEPVYKLAKLVLMQCHDVMQMDRPFCLVQLKQLVQKFGYMQTKLKIREMENRGIEYLKKYKSAYITATNWLSKN